MPTGCNTETLIADYEILAAGSRIPPEAHALVTSVEVDLDVENTGMFALELHAGELDQSRYTWVDSDLFTPGTEIKIKLGYGSTLTPVMVGEITALAPEYADHGAVVVTVRGYDRLYRLGFGRNTLTYRNMKDSDIAAQIAQNWNLSPQVDVTDTTHDYLLQCNQTDREFLAQRARRLRYELRVEDKTLYFQKPKEQAAASVTLTYGEDLIAFAPTLSTVRQTGKVVAQGWSVTDKRAVASTAVAGDVVSNMAGNETGPKAADRIAGQRVLVLAGENTADQSEAETLAKAALNRAAMEYVVGAGRCVGNPDIKAGTVVELSDDKFTVDNKQYFSFRIPDQFNVLIVTGDPASQFINLALAPSGSLTQYWSIKQAQPEDLGTIDLADYDVVMLAGAPQMSDAYVGRIKAAVRRGTSLLITYSATTDVGYFNKYWADITGVMIDEAARTDFTRAGYYTLESVTMEHPIFSVFEFASGLPDLKFYTLPKLHTVGDVKEIAQFSGKRPALLEASYGSGRVIVFMGPLAPEYSDITGHAFFVPFISRVAEYLAADLSSYDMNLYAGMNIPRVVNLSGAISGSMELVAPDSSRYFLSPEEAEGRLLLRANPTSWPGVYEIRYAGQEVDRFAVNVDPAECDLSAVDAERFGAAIGAPRYHELGQEADLASLISEFRFGREFWQVFLWMAAVLLLVEMLVARGASPEE